MNESLMNGTSLVVRNDKQEQQHQQQAVSASTVLCFVKRLLSCAPLPLPAGDTLFQMAEVHRQIQVQLEDVVSVFKHFVQVPIGCHVGYIITVFVGYSV